MLNNISFEFYVTQNKSKRYPKQIFGALDSFNIVEFFRIRNFNMVLKVNAFYMRIVGAFFACYLRIYYSN